PEAGGRPEGGSNAGLRPSRSSPGPPGNPCSASRSARPAAGGGWRRPRASALEAEAVPVGLAAPCGFGAGLPVRILVVGELDLHADWAREAARLQVVEDAWNVELTLAERREVEHALAAALVLQVDVADAAEPVLDVVLWTRPRVVDDVARVVVDLDPVAADLLEQI